MRRWFVFVIITCCVFAGLPARGQTIDVIKDAKLPRFEVASVKAGDPNAAGERRFSTGPLRAREHEPPQRLDDGVWSSQDLVETLSKRLKHGFELLRTDAAEMTVTAR
jgi:hypothetical protein